MALTSDRTRCTRCAVAAFLLACVVGCSKAPDLAVDRFETVDIELESGVKRQKAAKISSADTSKIDALVAVLRSAKATEDHKCSNTGQITLRKKDGGELQLRILAGHNPQYYEFRLYRGRSYEIFRVDRASFLKALAGLGVGELDPGLPE